MRIGPGVKVECMNCRHVGMLSDHSLSRLKIKPATAIVASIKRLRCSRRDSHSVSARRIGTFFPAQGHQGSWPHCR